MKIQNERDSKEDLDISRRMLLTWILKKQCGIVWAAVTWPRIGPRGKLL